MYTVEIGRTKESKTKKKQQESNKINNITWYNILD